MILSVINDKKRETTTTMANTETNHSENNKRIAKNTLLLYVRMLFSTLVSFYTSRVVLNTLGVEDFGIYNVVGGVIAMIGILNGAMSVSVQRFLNFELGAGDNKKLRQTFSMSLNIYALFALVFVVLTETIGVWFLNTHLLIPQERLLAANYVFQFSIFGMVFFLLSTPYNAAIIAHERMDFYAYTSIFDVLVKLAIVYLLVVISFDKLIGYGLFLTGATCLGALVSYIFCKRHFMECRYMLYWDKSLFGQLFSYFSWNLFGSASTLVKGEGLNILLNMFFNPAVNGARGIAYSINNVVMQFFNNFYAAVRPQIVKYYAQGDRESMLDLVFKSTKYSFFLCLIVSLPVLIEAPYLVYLWLGQTPEYTVTFARLIVVISIVDALAYPIMTAAHATGKIKLYQFVVGMITIMNIPVSYCVLKYVRTDPVVVYAVSLALAVIAFVVRLWIVKRLVNFSIRLYFRTVVLRILMLSALSVPLPLGLHLILGNGFISSAVVIIVSVVSSCILIYALGMSSTERTVVVNAARNKIKQYGIGR
jgi:O-antigen/teichoic acid export membrane protein